MIPCRDTEFSDVQYIKAAWSEHLDFHGEEEAAAPAFVEAAAE